MKLTRKQLRKLIREAMEVSDVMGIESYSDGEGEPYHHAAQQPNFQHVLIDIIKRLKVLEAGSGVNKEKV